MKRNLHIMIRAKFSDVKISGYADCGAGAVQEVQGRGEKPTAGTRLTENRNNGRTKQGTK